MNERDYKIAEAMILCTGAIVLVTILAIFCIYNLPFDINIIITINFIFFTTFFFGLLFHFKRRVMVKEFEKILEDTKRV